MTESRVALIGIIVSSKESVEQPPDPKAGGGDGVVDQEYARKQYVARQQLG